MSYWGRGLNRRPLPQTPTSARRYQDVEINSETVPKKLVPSEGVTSPKWVQLGSNHCQIRSKTVYHDAEQS